MPKLLRNYIFWNYERGSIHYDILVTLILAFIFITPHLWNYGDRPNPRQTSQVMVDNDGDGNLLYQVRAADVDKMAANTTTDQAIQDVIQPIAGDVHIDRYVVVPGPDHKPVAYKVWAHR